VPTVAELQVLLTARDDASRQLQRVGQEVQQLERRVQSTGAGFGTNLATGISGVADAFRLLGGAAQAVGGIIGGVADQIRQGFGTNIELERATVAFQRYTGSAQEAAAIIADLRREAAQSPFNDQEVIAAGRALIGFAEGSRDQLLELVRVAERLAVLDPTQGITGGVRALQEALGGQFRSFSERFEIPLTMIQRWRDEGLPALEVVRRGLEFRGIDAGAIVAYGRSFEGLLSTIQSFAQEIRGLATAGLFESVGRAFGHMVNLINEHGDRLRTIALAIGQVFGRLAELIAASLTGPVRALLNLLAPGLGDTFVSEFATQIERAGEAGRKAVPELQRVREALTMTGAREALRDAGDDLERLQSLAARTAAPVAVISRELGQIGVQAAEIQLGADRTRRGFEDQIRPLERQLDLLKNSAEVQRIQAALASNRATTERARLEREAAALERAAGGRTDPGAPDLTPRQRAIALALQERRLLLEELGLRQQQAPAIQSAEQALADLRRRQQEALEPAERLLAAYRDRVEVLNIERQRWEVLRGEIQAAVDYASQNPVRAAVGGPDAAQQADAAEQYRVAADALAKGYLAAFQKTLDENGGDVWKAIAATFTKWWEGGGKAQTVAVGQLVGTTFAQAAGFAFGEVFWPLVADAIGRAAVEIGRQVVGGPVGPSEVGGSVAAGIPGGPLPTSITVNVGDVVAGDPGLVDRLRLAIHGAILAVITASANVATGPQQPLPGSVR
jgi:hypothetical protein